MPTRTVDVKVLADSAQYEAAMARAGASTDHLAKEMDKAAKESKELTAATLAARAATLDATKAADQAAAAQNRASTAAERAARAQVIAGVAAEEAADAAKKLERGEIDEAAAKKLQTEAARKDRTAQLADAAAQRAAADAAEKLERASIKAGAAQLAQSKAAKSNGSLGVNIEKAGGDAGRLFGNGLSGALKTIAKLPPEISIPVIIGGVTIATAALSYIGAAVGGAIVGAVGLVGFGAAIAGQIKDPQVVAALQGLKAQAKAVLSDSSSAFTEPLLEGIQILDNGLVKISPELTQIFDALAPSFLTFVRGVEGLAENVMPGLVEGAEAAAPVLSAIGDELPGLGRSISGFFSDISTDSQSSAAAIRLSFKLAEVAIADLAFVLKALTVSFGFLLADTKLVVDVLAKVPGMQAQWRPVADQIDQLYASTNQAAGAANEAATATSGYADAAGGATSATQDMNAALQQASDRFDSLLNNALAASNADLAFEDALAGVTKAAHDNGTSLDANTAKGRQNIEMFNDLISKAEANRQANIANGMSIDQANAKFDAQVSAIYRQAAAAGYSTKQIGSLIAKLFGIPKSVAAQVNLYGAKTAREQADALRLALDKIHNKIVTITTNHIEYRTNAGGRLLTPYADGGIVNAYADGGVEDHSAQIAAVGTPMRLWNEPEAGGEAYLPLGANKRAQSIPIWQEAGRRLGIPQASASMVVQPVTVAPSYDVHVYIGNQEITGIVRTEIRETNRSIKRRATSGVTR